MTAASVMAEFYIFNILKVRLSSLQVYAIMKEWINSILSPNTLGVDCVKNTVEIHHDDVDT